jgi:heme-degrading monooxygenase HmoA
VEGIVIARHWRGWTLVENGDAYERLLREQVFPALQGIAGYRGGYVLRSDGAHEAEFVVVSLFDSLEAVRRFAGADYAVPVFEPEAKQLLSRIEPTAAHYEVRISTV